MRVKLAVRCWPSSWTLYMPMMQWAWIFLGFSEPWRQRSPAVVQAHPSVTIFRSRGETGMRLAAVLLFGLLVVLRPAQSAENGRYEIAPGPPKILLDTLSGKTWRYDSAGQWVPIQRLLPKLSPKRNETPQQQRQRESDARRLPLNKAGPKPNPKSPARSFLDKLAPPK